MEIGYRLKNISGWVNHVPTPEEALALMVTVIASIVALAGI